MFITLLCSVKKKATKKTLLYRVKNRDTDCNKHTYIYVIIAFACSLSTYTTVKSTFRTKMATTIVNKKILTVGKIKTNVKMLYVSVFLVFFFY